MKNDKRKANMEKYRAVLGAIGKANKLPGAGKGQETDLGVAYRMLCEMAEKGDHDLYAGVPAGFDWAGFKVDMEAAKK